MTDSTPPASDQTADIIPEGGSPSRGGIEPPSAVSAPRGAEARHRGGQPGNANSLAHGAPPGNNNAVKHGFYSSAFTRAEKKRLEEEFQGELNDEEECLRLTVRRFIDSMGDEKMYYKYLLAIRAICLAFGRIESLHRTRRVIYDKQTTLDQVWEELKLIPPEED
jgi:hypothetical protein